MPECFNETRFPRDLIRELSEAFETILVTGANLHDSIMKDHDSGYPVLIPTFGDSESDHRSYNARLAAMQSLTRLTICRDETSLRAAGIVCGSDTTVDAATTYNCAKQRFKKTVMAIRDFQSQDNAPASRISRLIKTEITEKGYRSTELRDAMRTARIADLDLKRCYAQIRIMPPQLEMISWTWTTKHSRIIRLSFDEAIKLAAELPNPKTAEIAASLIQAYCDPGQPLARKVPLPNQLRANYAWIENGEVLRGSAPISGVVIAQQSTLPRTLWRPDPGSSGENTPVRLSRKSSLEKNPVVQALQLYRYVH